MVASLLQCQHPTFTDLRFRAVSFIPFRYFLGTFWFCYGRQAEQNGARRGQTSQEGKERKKKSWTQFVSGLPL